MTSGESTFFGDDVHDVLVLLLDRPDRIVCEVAHVRTGEDLGDSGSWRDLLLALEKLIAEMLGEKISEALCNNVSNINLRRNGACRTCLHLKYLGTGTLPGRQTSVLSVRWGDRQLSYP